MAWNDDSWRDGYDAWKLASPDEDWQVDEDFCIIHGREHMQRHVGNPILFCQACEDDREIEESKRDSPQPTPDDDIKF